MSEKDTRTAELERDVVEAARNVRHWHDRKVGADDGVITSAEHFWKMHEAIQALDDHRQKAESVKVETPRCEPPAGTKYGTYHWVQSKHVDIRPAPFCWTATEGGAWTHFAGWHTVEAATALGYKYLGPCEFTGTSPAVPSSARVEFQEPTLAAVCELWGRTCYGDERDLVGPNLGGMILDYTRAALAKWGAR